MVDTTEQMGLGQLEERESKLAADLAVVDFRQAASGLPAEATERARSEFSINGAFIADNLVPKESLHEVQREISRLISIRRNHLGVQIDETEPDFSRFDRGFAALNRANRSEGGVIYDAAPRLATVQQLSVHQRLLACSRELMLSGLTMVHSERGLRIDQSGEQKYEFPWHQDYPYIQDSEDAVVFWIPLHNVSADNGAVRLLLRSHKLGIQKVRIVDPNNTNANGARTMELAETDMVNRYPMVQPSLKLGQILVFSALTIHSSGRNMSGLSRWSLQFRHGNFENPDSIQRRWPGGIVEGVLFSDRHPEYTV